MSSAMPWRRHRQTIDVVSPFPEEERVRHRPRWYERIRGFFGYAFLIVLMGVLAAIAVAVALVALAIFVATAFN